MADIKLADEIRNYCIENYVKPARIKKLALVKIRVGEVHTRLGYKNRLPAVCAALGSEKFELQGEVKRFAIEGPLNGASTEFLFLLNGNNDADAVIPGYAKVVDETPNRSLIQLPFRQFPSIALQGDDLLSLQFVARNLLACLRNTPSEDAALELFEFIDDCYRRVSR